MTSLGKTGASLNLRQQESLCLLHLLQLLGCILDDLGFMLQYATDRL